MQGASSDGFEAGRSAGIGLAQARIPIAGEGHDLRRGLAGQLPRAGDCAEASLIPDDSGCMVPLVGDQLRAFLVRGQRTDRADPDRRGRADRNARARGRRAGAVLDRVAS